MRRASAIAMRRSCRAAGPGLAGAMQRPLSGLERGLDGRDQGSGIRDRGSGIRDQGTRAAGQQRRGRHRSRARRRQAAGDQWHRRHQPEGRAAGNASHYYSLTRMPTKGTLVVDGERFAVTGESWMDHEFGTSFLEPEQRGWDWLSIQLSDNRELMLYQLRRADGSRDPRSSGTLVDAERQDDASCRRGFHDDAGQGDVQVEERRRVSDRVDACRFPRSGSSSRVTTPLHDQELSLVRFNRHRLLGGDDRRGRPTGQQANGPTGNHGRRIPGNDRVSRQPRTECFLGR